MVENLTLQKATLRLKSHYKHHSYKPEVWINPDSSENPDVLKFYNSLYSELSDIIIGLALSSERKEICYTYVVPYDFTIFDKADYELISFFVSQYLSRCLVLPVNCIANPTTIRLTNVKGPAIYLKFIELLVFIG